jgi:hypothetical protein
MPQSNFSLRVGDPMKRNSRIGPVCHWDLLFYLPGLLWADAASAAEPVLSLRTVALSGAPAPGAPAGATFFSYAAPIINNSGDVGFFGRMTTGPGGVGNSNDSAFFLERGGTLELFVREGSQAPGTPADAKFNEFIAGSFQSGYGISNAGHVAFDAQLLSGSGGVTTSNNYGIWSNGGGSLALLARIGDQAAGAPEGALFDALSRPMLNDAGKAVFSGRMREDTGGVLLSNDEGIWSDRDGAVSLEIRENTVVPGAPPGTRIGDFATPPRINNAGKIAFASAIRLNGAPVGEAVWTDDGSALELVAQSGTQAPGAPAGTEFTDVNPPIINQRGEVGFHSFLTDNDDFPTLNHGIFIEQGDSLRLVARQGGQPPGLPAGARFTNVSSAFLLNDTGQVAFVGADDVNGVGIWSEGGGPLRQVTHRNALAPGTTDGVGFTVFSELAFNNAGQVVFLADRGTQGNGIWATDRSGELKAIAFRGMQLDVDDGPGVDLLTVQTINFRGGSSILRGQTGAFNDLGQVTFVASFTDGTRGVFVSNVVAVIPEPSCAALLISSGSIGLALRLRRRQPN